MLALHVSLVSKPRCFLNGRKSNEDALKERRRVSGLFNMMEPSLLQFYVSRQWLNKFKTFAEPGPISNSDFLCSHGGAYDSFHSSCLTYSEVRASWRRKSFFFFLLLAWCLCFLTLCLIPAVELPSIPSAAQRQPSKGVFFYSSLCRRSSSSLVVEKGEELKSGRASHAPLFPSLSWQRAAEMMDLEITQWKIQNPCQKFSFVALEMKLQQSFCHTANEHCLRILQNYGPLFLSYFDKGGTGKKERWGSNDILSFSQDLRFFLRSALL